MARRRAAGTPQFLKVEGLKLFPDKDCNAKLPGGVYENEALPHAGGNQKKMTRASGAITGFSFNASKGEHEKLRSYNDSDRDDFTLSYKDRGGNIYRAVGFIKYDGLDDGDNKGTVDLIPANGLWSLFEP